MHKLHNIVYLSSLNPKKAGGGRFFAMLLSFLSFRRGGYFFVLFFGMRDAGFETVIRVSKLGIISIF